MTFSELYTETQEYFPKAGLTATKAKEFVNRAYIQMALQFQFYELVFEADVNTVADTPTVSRPTGARDIITIYDETNKRQLKPETVEFYDDQDTSTDFVGQPEVYVLIEDTNIYLYPTPDDVYVLRIRYRKLPDEMTSDGESPVFPEEWHEAILLLAANKAGMYLGFDSKAINLKNEALAVIASLTEDPTMAARRRVGQISVQRTRRSARDRSNTDHAEWL